MTGDVVHFDLGKGVMRPLIITSHNSDGTISGSLFLRPDDFTHEWVQRNCFYRPNPENAVVFVGRARRGSGTGTWAPIERTGATQ